MGSFRVNLKKVIDDSYDIEIGYELFDKLIVDLQNGLVPVDWQKLLSMYCGQRILQLYF